MKGVIFTGLCEYVEQEFGLDVWLKTLDRCELASHGEYLSTELYDDQEFFTIIDALIAQIDKPREELYRGFGYHFFPLLRSKVSKQIDNITYLFDFIRAIDNVIHIEVKKSDALAYTPTLLYDQPRDNVLIVRYVSHRKMCHFAEGLILAAADYFNQAVTLSQSQCLCKGDAHCLIRVQI